jgi:radical SAM protein with 4Fe4S-binding SPASM domain
VTTLPRELQVEVTGACNLSCAMCLVRYRPKLGRAEGSMDLGTFERLIEGLPGLERVTLQGLGEPLLVPGLLAMVRLAAGRGIRVGFNSNGMLLTRARAEELIEAGLDWLHVSLDGATAATHEAIRDGADFARIVENVRALAASVRRAGGARPRISLVFVAMRRNVGELPGLVRLAADCGVPRVRAQNLSHSFEDAADAESYAPIRDYTEQEALWEGDPAAEAAFARAGEEARRLGVDLRLPRMAVAPPPRAPGEPGCDWPWRSAYVTHRGQVQPCCMVMGADRISLGDATRDPLPEIWDGPAYRAFREALTSDRPPDVCRGCSMYRGVF